MPPLNCAIIGYGAIAEYHAAALAAVGARLVAVVGPSREAAQAFADRHRIPNVHIDIDSVLSSADVDAVVIASPSAVHAEHAVAALGAGKHVLCEIPVGLSLNEAEEVHRAVQDTGLVAMVCHTQRYWAPVVALKNLLEERRLTLRHVIARTVMRRRDNVGWTGRRRSWVDNLLWHHGCHAIDTTLLMIGDDPRTVFAVTGPSLGATGRLMDIGILIQGSSEAFGTISLSYNSTISVNDYFAIAEEDSFQIAGGKLIGQGGAVIAGGDSEEMQVQAVAEQDGEFIRAVATGQAPATSIESILPTMRVLQKIEDLRRADFVTA